MEYIYSHQQARYAALIVCQAVAMFCLIIMDVNIMKQVAHIMEYTSNVAHRTFCSCHNWDGVMNDYAEKRQAYNS